MVYSWNHVCIVTFTLASVQRGSTWSCVFLLTSTVSKYLFYDWAGVFSHCCVDPHRRDSHPISFHRWTWASVSARRQPSLLKMLSVCSQIKRIKAEWIVGSFPLLCPPLFKKPQQEWGTFRTGTAIKPHSVSCVAAGQMDFSTVHQSTDDKIGNNCFSSSRHRKYSISIISSDNVFF